MYTPWGESQTIETVADGILSVTTASHGGFLLDKRRTAAMPAYMTMTTWTGNYSAYEEDCDWCMPVLVFEPEFRTYYQQRAEGRDRLESIFKSAKDTLRHWHPDTYENFFNTILKPGESHVRDKKQFYRDNENNWIAAAAWGDWKDGVPKGMIAVRARIGVPGKPGPSKERYFLIPAAEYGEKASPFGFVVDLSRHQEIPPVT